MAKHLIKIEETQVRFLLSAPFKLKLNMGKLIMHIVTSMNESLISLSRRAANYVRGYRDADISVQHWRESMLLAFI